MVSEKDYILIEKYLDDALSSEEQDAFLSRVASDAALKKIFARAASQESWLKQKSQRKKTVADFTKIKNKIKNKSTQKTNKFKKNKKIQFWKIAATILLIITFTGSFLWFFTKKEQEIIHRPIAMTLGTQNQETAAKIAFNNEDYDEALPLIQEIIDNNKTFDYEWLRAQGICYLELQRWPEALGVFQRLETLSPMFENAAIFYQGMVFYRSNREIQAQAAFKKIRPGYYYLFAQGLLKDK